MINCKHDYRSHMNGDMWCGMCGAFYTFKLGEWKLPLIWMVNLGDERITDAIEEVATSGRSKSEQEAAEQVRRVEALRADHGLGK